MQFGTDFLIGVVIGILAGFIIGLLTGLFLHKKEMRFEKFLGAIFFFLWIGMHLYGFLNNKDIPFIFDVVGASSAGMMLGVKVSENIVGILSDKFGKGKKQ